MKFRSASSTFFSPVACAILALAVQSGLAAEGDAPAAQRTITHEQIESRYADADSKFADVDGVRIHYKDQGRGPAVLLIHGSLGDLSDWDGWTKILLARYRVVRLDLPGFGLSGPIDNDNYSIDRSHALIDGLMDTLGIERFAIVGVSYGGPVAFRYAATRTERVSALIIMNSAGIEYGKQEVDPKTGRKNFYAGTASAEPVKMEFIANGLRKSFQDPARIPPGMAQRKLDQLNVIGRERESAIMVGQYVRGTPERVLAHVRAPTLVLWGAAERSLSLDTADRFVAGLTRAKSVRKVMQPGGDHYMHVELPEDTGRKAAAFLDDVVRR